MKPFGSFLLRCIDLQGDIQFLELAVERYLDKFLELKKRHPKVTLWRAV